MKIFVHMPVRNEGARWLDSCLAWASTFADGIHVYDDRSDDDTTAIAAKYATALTVRGPDAPSFLDHEGRFREDAWRAFEGTMQPDPGDWVLALDADEFLVGADDDLRSHLREKVAFADRSNFVAIVLPVPEMFDATFDAAGNVVKLERRMDGLWHTIAGTRLFRYERDGIFRQRPMGCGSEPTYVTASNRKYLTTDLSLWLLHLGYVQDVDKVMKHERYTALIDNGHNNKHVQSIIARKAYRLETWTGPIPPIWLGERHSLEDEVDNAA